MIAVEPFVAGSSEPLSSSLGPLGHRSTYKCCRFSTQPRLSFTNLRVNTRRYGVSASFRVTEVDTILLPDMMSGIAWFVRQGPRFTRSYTRRTACALLCRVGVGHFGFLRFKPQYSSQAMRDLATRSIPKNHVVANVSPGQSRAISSCAINLGEETSNNAHSTDEEAVPTLSKVQRERSTSITTSSASVIGSQFPRGRRADG
jgi:hypothetical protein